MVLKQLKLGIHGIIIDILDNRSFSLPNQSKFLIRVATDPKYLKDLSNDSGSDSCRVAGARLDIKP